MPHSGTTYFVINKQSGTALDLVLGDRKTVTSYDRHGQDNQRWRFIEHDDGWVIQNVATDQYLGVEEPGTPTNKDKIIGLKTVRGDGTRDGLRIVYKGTNKLVGTSESVNSGFTGADIEARTDVGLTGGMDGAEDDSGTGSDSDSDSDGD